MNAAHLEPLLKLAAAHHAAGKLGEAEAVYTQVLAAYPDHPGGLAGLGAVLIRTDRAEQGVVLLQKLIALHPNSTSNLLNLASGLDRLNQTDQAIIHLRHALRINPNYAPAHCNIGEMLRRMGQAQEAETHCRKAISINPNLVEAHRHLARILLRAGKFDEAARHLRQAIALRPAWEEPYSLLGEALYHLGEYDHAINAANRALELAPRFEPPLNALGNCYLKTGQIDRAIETFGRITGPLAALAADNRLFCLHFSPGWDSPAILREHQKWYERFARPIARDNLPHACPSNPDRRLRVGYVSTDFYGHCQTLFTKPLLSHHDRSKFELFAYADVALPDACTSQLQSLFDCWRVTTGLTDAALADTIRRDGIDILIDLGMHMGNARPLVFARKPAPVQVAWLAYPGTTGIPEIDARFTDPFLDPPGMHDDWYTERSVRLPDTFWCYDPAALHSGPSPLPEVSQPPFKRNGFITFGSLNNFCKVNDSLMRLWSRVLAAVPDSRLLMLVPPGESRTRVQRAFASCGISAGRIDFVPVQSRAAYIAEYCRVDIALDTLPYNGHTTSLDALWMSVPLVSRLGNTVAGRAGLSQLSNLGLTELLATDDGQFVKIATALANDSARLADFRATLRRRMESSPLMDAPRFARGFEAALLGLWSDWVGPRQRGMAR